MSQQIKPFPNKSYIKVFRQGNGCECNEYDCENCPEEAFVRICNYDGCSTEVRGYNQCGCGYDEDTPYGCKCFLFCRQHRDTPEANHSIRIWKVTYFRRFFDPSILANVNHDLKKRYWEIEKRSEKYYDQVPQKIIAKIGEFEVKSTFDTLPKNRDEMVIFDTETSKLVELEIDHSYRLIGI